MTEEIPAAAGSELDGDRDTRPAPADQPDGHGNRDGDGDREREIDSRTRPAHVSLANVALVAAGGAVGTALRYGLTLVLPPRLGVPVAIAAVNILGAILLGLLLEVLVEGGIDEGRRRRLRLGIGTGILGGFTTYSTLATDNVALALTHPAVAVAYGLGTVIIGAAASLAGIALAGRALRPAVRSRSVRP